MDTRNMDFGVRVRSSPQAGMALLGLAVCGLATGQERTSHPALSDGCHVDYDVTVTKARFTGGIEYKFSGPMFYAVTTF